MSLDENAMAALVKSNIQAIANYPNSGENPVFVRDDILVAFCKGIIDHIKAAGVVTTTGVAAGAVTRTGTIT